MKKSLLNNLITISTLICGLCACFQANAATRGTKYASFYEEHPSNIIVLPVFNHTEEPECVSYFQNSADSILLAKGYNLLHTDYAYAASTQAQNVKTSFFEIHINRWTSSKVEGLFNVEIVYLIKSQETNNVLYKKEANITVKNYLKLGGGKLINIIATSIKNNTMNKTWVGKTCANYLLSDLPEGINSDKYLKDKKKKASKTSVKKKLKCLHSNY
ncbi:MAG: hypothetical protein KBT20_10600 [Bacteroidales bacterium]|nr:hypothetical protein [Candidatus Liminaster caballi]